MLSCRLLCRVAFFFWLLLFLLQFSLSLSHSLVVVVVVVVVEMWWASALAHIEINLHIGFTWLAYNGISQRTKFTFLSVERICVTPSTELLPQHFTSHRIYCFVSVVDSELCAHLYVFQWNLQFKQKKKKTNSKRTSNVNRKKEKNKQASNSRWRKC